MQKMFCIICQIKIVNVSITNSDQQCKYFFQQCLFMIGQVDCPWFITDWTKTQTAKLKPF